MALSPTPLSPAATNVTHLSHSLRFQRLQALSEAQLLKRRTIGLALGSVMLSLKVVDVREAIAAGRRPPPPPLELEKKDPNVSGVQAKVLASKKRKEAMKASMAKLRDKGKLVDEPSSTQ